MQQVKSLWQTISVVVIILGALMITGGLLMNNNLLFAGALVVMGLGVGLQGLHAVVYAEASIKVSRYHSRTRTGWGARLYGVQEGYIGAVLVLGGLWQAVAPGQMLKAAATPFGWSLISVLVAILIMLGSVVLLSGVSDWSESAWHTIPNRIFGVIGLLIAAVVGAFGITTVLFPTIWKILSGMLPQVLGR